MSTGATASAIKLFKNNQVHIMKKYLLLITFMLLVAAGCQKEATAEGVTYTITVNVEDNLSYSLKISDGKETFYNVIPPSKNASTSVQHYQKKGTTAYIYAETNQYFKGKLIEVIVTKNDTGEIIVSKKQADRVHQGWTVE